MDLYDKIVDQRNLNLAWNKVRNNKGAPGCDNITVEEFQSRKKEYIKQLYIELKEERYTPHPALIKEIISGEKNRRISMLCVRDKVVQQSIVNYINNIYEPMLPECAYAYRGKKSALLAVEQIEEWLCENDDLYYIKADITDYFEHINTTKIIDILSATIDSKRVLKLIKQCLQMRSIDLDGELHDKKEGLYQGSILSPVLSNIYLMEFDLLIMDMNRQYIRYSDDMILLGKKDVLLSVLEKIKEYLKQLGLELKETKTEIGPVEDSFIFLGYQFSDKGKAIPIKATNRLSEKLEECWFDSDMNFNTKVKKCREIIGGWEQYYRGDRIPSSIYEYLVTVYMMSIKNKDSEVIDGLRWNYNNVHKDILKYMVQYWKNKNELINVIKEYEQYFQIDNVDSDKLVDIEEYIMNQLIEKYDEILITETDEIITELMQLYTDGKCYNKARYLSDIIRKRNEVLTDKTPKQNSQTFIPSDSHIVRDIINLSQAEQTKFGNIFLGREDIYKTATLLDNGRFTYDIVKESVSPDIIKSHLLGNITAATFLQQNNGTVKYMIFDIDISRYILIDCAYDDKQIDGYLKQALNIANIVKCRLRKLGIESYIEYSGYRGYHVWVFFDEWISTSYVNMLQDIVLDTEPMQSKEISVECFPNKTRIKGNKLGQAIKLPWGVHYTSGKRSYFLDEELNPMVNQKAIFDSIVKYNFSTVKKVIANNTKEQFSSVEKNQIDIGELGKLDEVISTVLSSCGLLLHLCIKAKRTGYLPHFERLTILYVFGHLGESGKRFVHQVMEYTLNYQYHITERYINKIPEKPISCVKLREQYKQLTATVGCSCHFNRTKNCYPSPVLHAVKNAESLEDDITIPTVRKLSAKETKQIPNEINVHKRSEEAARKLMELKKQERGVHRAVEKQEKELEQIFDSLNIDCLELELGVLCRIKTEKGYNWVIEL